MQDEDHEDDGYLEELPEMEKKVFWSSKVRHGDGASATEICLADGRMLPDSGEKEVAE